MEKLSIEEKAKAYDEAIERMKSWVRGEHPECFTEAQKAAEFIFPELKESEDEKIMGAFRDFAENYLFWGKLELTKEKALAWLEKQGNNNMGISEATKQKLEDNLNKALEKETPESWNEFLDEKKSADKVEPKFHEGEWLVSIEHGNVIRVLEILEDNYRLDFGKDTIGTLCTEFVDNEYRLWTIQDTKDGDVLYCESSGIEYIVMSKGINKYGHIDSYFRYNSLNGFGVDIPSVFSIEQDNITLATKEQRDLLLQKMKEAGYEWNAERKELKKIEQNSAWSEEDDIMAHDIEYALRCQITYPLSKLQSMLNWILNLKERYTWKPSDRQMQQLGWIAEQNEHNLIGKELMTLYKDLKKLREE